MDEEKIDLCFDLWRKTGNPFFGLRALELGWDPEGPDEFKFDLHEDYDWIGQCLDEIEGRIARGSVRVQVHPGRQGRKMDPPPIDEKIVSQPVTIKEVGRNSLKTEVDRWTRPPRWWRRNPWEPEVYDPSSISHMYLTREEFESKQRKDYEWYLSSDPRLTYPEMAKLVEVLRDEKRGPKSILYLTYEGTEPIKLISACKHLAKEIDANFSAEDVFEATYVTGNPWNSIYKFIKRDWEPFNAAQG